MSPLSSDPAAAARQVANLRRGVTTAPLGNQRAVRHGAYAAEVKASDLDAEVARIYDALAADAPLRDADDNLPAADGAAVHLAAQVMCRLRSLSQWLADHGWLDAKGNPRESLLDLERRLSAQAGDHLDALGMSTRSRARLGLDVARTMGLDLARQWADDEEHEPPVEGTVSDA